MEEKKKSPFSPPPTKRRDLLDIFESYKYMNSDLYDSLVFDGRWDYGTGWVELHYPYEDWTPRQEHGMFFPVPESTTQ